MFLKIKKGKQEELIRNAISKAGSERKLIEIFSLSKGGIYKYKSEKGNIPKELFYRLLKYINRDSHYFEKYIKRTLSLNWGQVKGGKECVNRKKREGKFEETIKKLKKSSSERMKIWHKKMKKESPKEYHIWQYERFKKMGRGYNFRLNNEIKVRNKLEKEVGNLLISEGFFFEYEPYVNIKGKAYFPDFKINMKIIEVTEWNHPNKQKVQYLKKKIKDYEKLGLKVRFFIPLRVRKFYKGIESYIISALPDLKEFLMPP